MTKTKMISPSFAGLHFDKLSSPPTSSKMEIDANNNEKQTAPYAKHHRQQTAAVAFKYHSNAASRDIDDLRQMLASLRREQANFMDPEEHKFYESDFERMMTDNWLVTRFLLRGKKIFEKEAELGRGHEILKSESSNDVQDLDQLNRQAVLMHTIELVKVCARYRFDYRINQQTNSDQFPLEWTKTDGLFNYKPDAEGNPTIYLRVAFHRPKLIATPEARHLFKRYMLHTVERCDQELNNKPGKAICCVFDMTNVAFENIDLELTTWMIKSFKSSSPKLICYVIIYNPPWFFTTTFKVICNTLLSNSKRQSVKFATGDEILNYINHANLPPYLKSSVG